MPSWWFSFRPIRTKFNSITKNWTDSIQKCFSLKSALTESPTRNAAYNFGGNKKLERKPLRVRTTKKEVYSPRWPSRLIVYQVPGTVLLTAFTVRVSYSKRQTKQNKIPHLLIPKNVLSRNLTFEAGNTKRCIHFCVATKKKKGDQHHQQTDSKQNRPPTFEVAPSGQTRHPPGHFFVLHSFCYVRVTVLSLQSWGWYLNSSFDNPRRCTPETSSTRYQVQDILYTRYARRRGASRALIVDGGVIGSWVCCFLSTCRHPAHPAPALILHPREIHHIGHTHLFRGIYICRSFVITELLSL